MRGWPPANEHFESNVLPRNRPRGLHNFAALLPIESTSSRACPTRVRTSVLGRTESEKC